MYRSHLGGGSCQNSDSDPVGMGGPELPSGSQVMLMLLIHGPHLEQGRVKARKKRGLGEEEDATSLFSL